MLIVEYDHRSLKALPRDGHSLDMALLKEFVGLIKKHVPTAVRTYNPETHVWFISEPYLKLLRQETANMDVSWEKRI